MANNDVIYTLAGQFQTPFLDEHKQRALKVLVNYLAQASAGGVAPTLAQQTTFISQGVKAMSGVDIGNFGAVETAILEQYANGALSNSGLVATPISANSQLAAASVFLALDDKTLRLLEIYSLGRLLAVLT